MALIYLDVYVCAWVRPLAHGCTLVHLHTYAKSMTPRTHRKEAGKGREVQPNKPKSRFHVQARRWMQHSDGEIHSGLKEA